MSEEVRDASRAIPRSMLSVWVINTLLAFTSFITVAYHLPDVEAALGDPTLFPIIYVLRQSMSREWMTVLIVVVLVLIICSNMTYLAATTRDIWAFARDDGFPFSRWISKVDEKRHVPRNAVIVTSCVAVCLSLIYIGSPVAYYAMVSLVSVALLQCYCLSIGCMLYRRIAAPETLPPARFSLGKFGIPINIAAVCYR
jgi:choline transport protein